MSSQYNSTKQLTKCRNDVIIRLIAKSETDHMATSISIKEAVDIINISPLEDVLILKDTYRNKLNKPSCDKERLIVLQKAAEARIKELSCQ